MSIPNEQFRDSDEDEEFEDVEFEDVPLQAPGANGDHQPPPAVRWSPTLTLPQQRNEPLALGSNEETRLRNRLSEGIDQINYREMRTRMGMDTPDTPAAERGYESFSQLCREVEALVDLLWASATPSVQGEGLITLAGLTKAALQTHPFDPASTLNILYRFDQIFAALCTGQHPLTGAPLPGTQSGRSLVTQTQKVRIQSLAESTRSKVFCCLINEDEDGEDDAMGAWSLAATKVYEATLMLLGDQGDIDDAGRLECPW
ncbi:hypothetical protein N7492_004027 [Penicillium capsulatum]|uniref:Uncharacterized protein n=1 Tax=Penicillium capsulatum TaxID=69766 RepID=A0A9W9LY03_9EURO|nr:hypothetical protein N7492_004027 [Penicillium capsulatum]KAJ6121398.1 hypothetical protein N7512_003863 [Penicillium capsulatum]